MKKDNHLTIQPCDAKKPSRHIFISSYLHIVILFFTFYLLPFTFKDSVHATDCGQTTTNPSSCIAECPAQIQQYVPETGQNIYICQKASTAKPVYAYNCGDIVPSDKLNECNPTCPAKPFGSLFQCTVQSSNTTNNTGSIYNPVLDPSVGTGEGNVILAKLLAAIINLFFIAGSVAVLVFFLIGGLAWITSEGDKGKMELAKNRLTFAGVGIVIIAATYAILQILGLFLGISFFKGLIITWPTLTGP